MDFIERAVSRSDLVVRDQKPDIVAKFPNNRYLPQTRSQSNSALVQNGLGNLARLHVAGKIAPTGNLAVRFE